MKVLVPGGSGMLGHQLCLNLADRMEVWGTFSYEPECYTKFALLSSKRIIGNIETENMTKVREVLDIIKPDAVINGIGIAK